ncbi:MAG: RidA family protein [Pseudomonadota bacterium]
MAGRVETKLAALGIELPGAPAPAANYTPYVLSGALLFISGQLPLQDGALMTGKLGADRDVSAGAAAARACALALIAQARAACDGDLDRVRRVVKLTGFVNAAPDFAEHPAVVNGASDVIAEVFGARGTHARAAVGCGSLPFGVMVEVEGVFEIEI